MDGADTTPSNSKVIVQCTDPSNLFDSVEPRLSSRSPLKNLHWKSPNRPLRSIPNLNIALTREQTANGSHASIRRHQIPGLRETPYVKLYLLRCDDKETYKEKARKEVRQWVKSVTPTGESKSALKTQENHDASEWLIVHVVLSNTPAASQPRSSKHITLETAESTDSVNSKSKWSGKSSSTIFDKLRADFSSSSKSSITRVSQIRLLEPNDKSTALTPAELEEQWQDLVECLKACILRSFDARVAQYELDIRERDNQRSLPGWNFCTFFVLKEGLARGFENVGLLDDALSVYDELSVGLDTLIKEASEKGDDDENGALLLFSKESKALLRAALEANTKVTPIPSHNVPMHLSQLLVADRAHFPFDVDRQRYRELILSNEVSALDLRVYLFTRQIEILLRQAEAPSPTVQAPQKTAINLHIVGDVAERATHFINLAGRILRLELYMAWGGQEGLSEEELHSQRTVTGNIVSSWTWCAILQILSKVTPALGVDLVYWTSSLSIDALELAQNAEAAPETLLSDVETHLHRLSLASNLGSSSRDQPLDRNHRHSMMADSTNLQQVLLSRPGSERLLFWVSKLSLMARRVLQNLEAAKVWTAELKKCVTMALKGQETRLDCDSEIIDDTGDGESDGEGLAGLQSQVLRAVAISRTTFLELYILLTIFSYRLLGRTKSYTALHQALVDLVEFEYAQKNFAIAARYLGSILGPLPRPSRHPADNHLLRIYADCLRHLDRPNEYAKCLISCLQSVPHDRVQASPDSSKDIQPLQAQLSEVLKVVTPITLRLTSIFHVSDIATTIRHPEGKDGFALQIALQTLSGPSAILAHEIRLRLSAKDGHEPRYINLQSSGPVQITERATAIVLETSVMSQGWYKVDEIEARIGNLRLLHHFQSLHEADQNEEEDSRTPRTAVVPILVYPHDRSFAIRIRSSSTLHLSETRRLWIEVRPGHNHITQCRLRLKTATAGLRLNVHDARLIGSDRSPDSLRTAREGDTLLMVIDELTAESLVVIEIPYTLEIPSSASISIRIDAGYETQHGSFNLYETAAVNVLLPVIVNVQDVYRPFCTYSRFTISPSTLVPLTLLSCHLKENEYYAVELPDKHQDSVVVFPRQPASWTVRLVPKNEEACRATRKLTLVVEYQCLDDVILSALEEHLKSALLLSDYAFAARLLSSHLEDQVRGAWTEQDLEVAGLTQEMEIWDKGDLDWPSVLCAIDRSDRAGLDAWLSSWHAQSRSIQLSGAQWCRRQLRLQVDVPPPPLVVVANLQIQKKPSEEATATVGQPLLAVLELSLSRPQSEPIEGVFELVAVADSWLIGGRRKGNVQLQRECVEIPTVLFPQQVGYLLLPTVTIKCRRKVRRSEKGSRDSWTEVNSEVYNTGQGRSILVIPDLRSTTVEVFGAASDSGTGRLVGTRHRGHLIG
ncbi:uncharacterized protein A1O9_12668 [Exophiala aquamarina CBS 119918]|uniref:TMEM1 family protein n=1 Tax=Exophiala aquamarina CBS 119918 TaxID=1182545 RepID=A0A072NWD3_9EURO|nr:uncharacterized protein A1O9_12668 [Exophiala aquamarina CBS 119918]KEF51318.1 hypothetical protein A1O9_12668 [Exophiala aquamarina CBS 119918]